MNKNQKLLMIIGAALTVISALYMTMMGIPNTPASAMMFPLSILGFFFGIGFIIWSLAWIALERTEILQ